MKKRLISLKTLVNKNVFVPTGTSDLLIEASTKIIKGNKSILDLGCGNGIVGISLSKIKRIKKKVYFSDISDSACKNNEQNCKKFKVKCEVKKGKIFNPWKNYKFDYIISDVAAIADEAAKISPWYRNCTNDAGIDGTKNVINFLNEAEFYLNKKGSILFPIIFVKEKNNIIIKKKFKNINLIKSKIWPLPKSMCKNINC